MLERLAELVRGGQPIDGISSLLGETVRFHIDNLTTTITAEGWKLWVRYMREEGGVRDLDINLDEIRKHPDGTVAAVAHWSGVRGGRHAVSDPCSARYLIRDGHIHEIWTCRANYIFPLGGSMRSRLGLLLMYLRMVWWGAWGRGR